MAAPRLDVMQGTLELIIMRTLAWSSMHGYGISQWVRQRTDGALAIQDAALYQALRRLERKGWVSAEWGVSENNRRARYYALTREGRRELRAETSAWQRYAEAVFKVLEPLPGES